MPRGDLYVIALRVLQRALAALGAYDYGMMVGPTVLTKDAVFDPEIAFLSSPDAAGVPRQEDVQFVIEVSHTSRGYDLGRKRDAYAEAHIPYKLSVDTVKCGVWDFSKPVDGVYNATQFVAAGEAIEIPLSVPLSTRNRRFLS